jgi:hypothetical protein
MLARKKPASSPLPTLRCMGLTSRHLESRAKASARLVLKVSAGWLSPSSRGLRGGDALLLSTGAAGSRNPNSTPRPVQATPRALYVRDVPSNTLRTLTTGESPAGWFDPAQVR